MNHEKYIGEWYQLVSEASLRLGYTLTENIGSYLILTLDHYATDSQLPNQVLALDFLEGFNHKGRSALDQLRSTGDRCLILAGLFPERAKRFNLKESYFIEIGQQAYHTLASRSVLHYDPHLFDALCREFVVLTELLLTMRSCREVIALSKDFRH